MHGGGFYRVQKFRRRAGGCPSTLHWFKWEAYTTWLSGFALLRRPLLPRGASATSSTRGRRPRPVAGGRDQRSALLAVAWLVYDVLCRGRRRHELRALAPCSSRSSRSPRGARGELFSARAACLQVGAMLGTMMVGNVFFVIIPAHWELIRAKEAGREPDPRPGLEGKQRSVHNNYLTLPVLLDDARGARSVRLRRRHGWLVLRRADGDRRLGRLFFNLRHHRPDASGDPGRRRCGVLALAICDPPDDDAQPRAAPRGAVRAGRGDRRRSAAPPATRRSPTPARPAPGSTRHDDSIRAPGRRVDERAVRDACMPLGNDRDDGRRARDARRWVEQGAAIGRADARDHGGGFSFVARLEEEAAPRRSPRSGGCSRSSRGSSTSAGAARRAGSRSATSTSGSAPRTRRAIRTPARSCSTRAASARPRSCSRTATSASPRRPARWRATTSRRSSRAASTCASSARSPLGGRAGDRLPRG